MKHLTYKRIFFISLVLIVFGVIVQTTLKDVSGPLGIVLIAVGGLFFIISMANKKK